jgi:hypothetical protein
MATDQELKKKNRESSIRWQGRTIEQFGYALNLILGLSVAAIGFEISLALGDEFKNDGWQNYLFAISLFSLLVSVAVGLFCVVNRLRDFRATAETARKHEDDPLDPELQPLRTLSRELGKRTWRLFRWQVATFGIGVLLLVLAVGSVLAKALQVTT